jgi:hypothetical protein
VTGRAWAYLGAGLGGAVSIAANVAHSYVPPTTATPDWTPPIGAVIGAVFWPIALVVAIEILARVAWPTGTRWIIVRYLGLLPVAAVAAVVSYRHMSGLLTWYGEDTITALFGPLAVDGLMVMATGALIATSSHNTPDPDPGIDQPKQATDDVTDVATPGHVLVPLTMWPGAVPLPLPNHSDIDDDEPTDATDDVTDVATPDRTRRAPAADKVARFRTRYPAAGQEEIARRSDVSLRTVQRHWTDTTPNQPINGHTPAPEGAR